MIRALAQAGDRAGRTGHSLQWRGHSPENAATPTAGKQCNANFACKCFQLHAPYMVSAARPVLWHAPGRSQGGQFARCIDIRRKCCRNNTEGCLVHVDYVVFEIKTDHRPRRATRSASRGGGSDSSHWICFFSRVGTLAITPTSLTHTTRTHHTHARPPICHAHAHTPLSATHIHTHKRFDSAMASRLVMDSWQFHLIPF